MNPHCELCESDGGELVYRNKLLRVVLVDDALYPGFCRVIWNDHVKEMSDLTGQDRQLLMEQVYKVEAAVRNVMAPDKINLASFGNMTPHLHWHVIPRYADDVHFPGPVWAPAQRESDQSTLSYRRSLLPALREALNGCLN